MSDGHHHTVVMVTPAIMGSGKWHQARCDCGWVSGKSFTTKAPAEDDANEHVRLATDDGA